MKKKLTLGLFSTLVACIGQAQDSISVLFIGNSYTYVNDLPTTLSNLSSNLGKTITFDSKTNGGYTFQNHINDPLTFTKIHAKPWDVVVLQGQSQEPSFPTSQVNTNTLPYAVRLADSVYSNNTCGNVMYFMTWGRKVGDPQWDSINTFEKMNNRLYNAYMRIADASDKAMVSPVGSVWAYVRQQHPTIELYSGDGSHPSLAGTYLSACVFHTALFRSNTTGATYLGGLDATTAGILQQAADHVLDSLQKFRLHPINEPTQALFNYTAQGLSIQFNNASYHAADYSWNFGDGSPSNITENPMHTYTTNGTYIVTLTANSICNSDTETMQLSVTTAGLQDEKNNFISVKNVEGGILIKSTEELVEIQVYTTDGRLIYHKKQLDSQSVFVPSSNQVLIIQTTTKQGGIQQIRVVS